MQITQHFEPTHFNDSVFTYIAHPFHSSIDTSQTQNYFHKVSLNSARLLDSTFERVTARIGADALKYVGVRPGEQFSTS